jgi:hypothetical protein
VSKPRVVAFEKVIFRLEVRALFEAQMACQLHLRLELVFCLVLAYTARESVSSFFWWRTKFDQCESTVVVVVGAAPGGRELGEQCQGEGGGEPELHDELDRWVCFEVVEVDCGGASDG